MIDYYYDGMGFSFGGQSYASATNQNGYRTGMQVNGSNAATWTYDTRGRVTGEQRMFIGAAFNTGWTYNSADLPVTMTYPDGEQVTYEYNNRMLVDTLSGTGNYVTGTEYDTAGRIDLRTFGNGTQTDYQYFPWNQQGGGASSPSPIKDPPSSVPQCPLCAAPLRSALWVWVGGSAESACSFLRPYHC